MRGLYGQAEGNEKRGSFEQFGDRLDENQLVEGEHVAALRKLVADLKWGAVTRYTERLRSAGHGHSRVESMLSRAMAGLKF